MKKTIIGLLSLILFTSCESKAQKNKNAFCVNTNKTKTPAECEECLLVLDEMVSKKEIERKGYIIKKLNYFLLLKKYDDALNFLDKEQFIYSQEKDIRKKEILLVKSFCSHSTDYNIEKNDLLSFIDNEMIKTKDNKLIEILKNEKSSVESDIIVTYYCSASQDKTEKVSVITQ